MRELTGLVRFKRRLGLEREEQREARRAETSLVRLGGDFSNEMGRGMQIDTQLCLSQTCVFKA